jgi:hypothetical protein
VQLESLVLRGLYFGKFTDVIRAGYASAVVGGPRGNQNTSICIYNNNLGYGEFVLLFSTN